MKKLFFAAILVLLSFGISGCLSHSDQTDFSYEETEGGWMLAAVVNQSENVVIPDSYKEQPVVAIKESAFYANETIRCLTIPATVRSIGSYAFADCTHLSKVVFESGGRCAVGDSAFESCSYILKLSFNNSVISVGDSAFKNCKRIFSLSVGSELKTIGQDAFTGCERMIFKADAGSTAESYAVENHLCTRFSDSVYFVYIIVILGVVLGAVFLSVYGRVSKTKKKNKNIS